MKASIERINREKILLILNWCEKKFGKSKYWETMPRLRVYKTNGHTKIKRYKEGIFGYFIDNEIVIFVGKHNSIKSLCSTVIHEYKHYLSDFREWETILNKKNNSTDSIHDSKYDVYNSSFEKKARRFENKWKDVCFNELRNKLYQK